MKTPDLKRILLILLLLMHSTHYLCGQNPDINLLKNINLNRNRSLDAPMLFITNGVGALTIILPATLTGISLARKDSSGFRKNLVLCSGVAFAGIVSTVLKYSVNRPRPFVTYPEIDKQTKAGSPSFPSGHTSAAFSLATGLTLAYPKWYIVAPAWAWAGTAAYSRMHLGAHYPSDVLAGAIIGAGSSWLGYYLNKKLLRDR